MGWGTDPQTDRGGSWNGSLGSTEQVTRSSHAPCLSIPVCKLRESLLGERGLAEGCIPEKPIYQTDGRGAACWERGWGNQSSGRVSPRSYRPAVVTVFSPTSGSQAHHGTPPSPPPAQNSTKARWFSSRESIQNPPFPEGKEKNLAPCPWGIFQRLRVFVFQVKNIKMKVIFSAGAGGWILAFPPWSPVTSLRRQGRNLCSEALGARAQVFDLQFQLSGLHVALL